MSFDPSSTLFGLNLLIKVGVAVIGGLYVLFALIVFQRVLTLTQTLITMVSPIIKVISVVHLIAAIGSLAVLIGLLIH